MDLGTKNFSEQHGGLLICGINWGGDPNKKQEPEILSFFSDSQLDPYPFRRRIRHWFELWGHPLEATRGRVGGFEQSIAHMNWLPDQSQSVRDRNYIKECIAQNDRFFSYAEILNPKLIMFFGIRLLEVINNTSCIKKADRLFGQSIRPRYLTKEVLSHNKKLKKFRVGFQTFERSEIIALPHTASIGLSDEYIGAFRPEIEPILSTYRLKFSVS